MKQKLEEKLEENFLIKNSMRFPVINQDIFYYNELKQEPLVNYLARKHKSNEDSLFENKDLSMIFRSGIDASHKNIIVQKTISDYIILGSIPYFDLENNTICIPTVLSTNRILEIKEQGKDNGFAIDLAVLKYLYSGDKDIKLAVIAIDRLFTNYKAMPTKLLNFIEVTDYYNSEEVEAKLIERIELLKSGKEPSICKNLRWHKRKGKNKNMTCAHYCSYNEVCRHFGTAKNYISTSSLSHLLG